MVFDLSLALISFYAICWREHLDGLNLGISIKVGNAFIPDINQFGLLVFFIKRRFGDGIK